MRTLKVLSLLLSYPQAETLEALDDMGQALIDEKRLPPAQVNALIDWMHGWRSLRLLDLQEEYVALFDRGRALSLHLFEHVHGESRDRGQAMADLMALYETHGFVIAARELPDYVPLFLEYLAQQTPEEAVSLLRDALPVLSLIGARLAERGSRYSAVFAALEAIAGAQPDESARMRRQAASEGPDATLAHMDDIWEEETVAFMANPGVCREATPLPAQQEQPMVFTPPSALTEHHP